MHNDLVEELYKKHYNNAFLYTLSLTRNKTIAEDIVSEAFIKALQTSDDILSFKSWLLTVCRNIFLNKIKKEKLSIELSEQIDDGKESLLEGIINDERYRALYHTIDLLPQNYKEVITLFYFENQKISEIALIINKSENNVKVLLNRAREKMKEILEEKGHGF